MAIHHDKLAYGKLAAMQEDFSEDALIQMAQALSAVEEKEYSNAMKKEECNNEKDL